MSFAQMAQNLVDQIADEAGIDKPEQLSVFLYYRAMGLPKSDKENQSIDDLMGVHRNTLTNWENKLEENISENLESELVANSVIAEHEKRFKQDD